MLNKVETFYSKEMNTSDFKCQSDSRAKSEQSHGHVFSVRIFSKALELWSENINVNFSKIIFNVKAIISRTAQTIFFESLIGKNFPRKFNINFICFLSIYCKHYGTNSFSFQQVSFFSEVWKKNLKPVSYIFS